MNYNPYSFISCDVIVWNGLVAEYGTVAPFVQEGDDMRRANDDELKNHSSAPVKSPYAIN